MRDPYFDNAKHVLIVLVVVGHAVQPLIDAFPATKLIYLVIYSFHMPLFAFISGYFAKDITQNSTGFKSITKYLLLYVVFESVCVALFYGNPLHIIAPADHMWYLLSLVFWCLLLPFFSRNKYLVILAVGLSLLTGYLTGGSPIFSASRTLAFLPFFVAGYHAGKAAFVPPVANKYIVISTMISITTLIYAFSGYHDLKTLFCGGGSFGAGIRLASLMAAVIMSYCFLTLIPRRQTWFTSLGSRTLAVYIIHWPIIKALEIAGLYKLITSPLAVIPIVASAVLLGIALSFIPSFALGKHKHGNTLLGKRKAAFK